MEKEFVTYEIASVLKELGFDEPCFGIWNKHKDKWIITLIYSGLLHQGYFNEKDSIKICAPLWQQVIDWLIENHHILIQRQFNGYSVIKNSIGKNSKIFISDINPEQAILKAIELIKNK